MFDKILNKYLREECGEMEQEILSSLSEDEIYNISEYGCCWAGAGNFLYYYQTNAFFNKYPEECLELLQLAISDCWIDPKNFNFRRNDIVWLAVEVTVQNFMSYYEDNKEEEEE